MKKFKYLLFALICLTCTAAKADPLTLIGSLIIPSSLGAVTISSWLYVVSYGVAAVGEPSTRRRQARGAS